MVALFRSGRKRAGFLSALAGLLFLASCDLPTVSGGPSIDTSRAVSVALLVPRSGSTAGLARDLENAARLAVSDLSGAEIDLQVYDTLGTAEGATFAAQQAAGNGAKIIIGPLFADAAAAAGAAVRGRGLNVLSFSNNTAVAGGNVYVLGATFSNTADRLSGYAASRGITSAAVVYGQTTAEEIGRDAVTRALSSNGVLVSTVASFPVSQQGIIDAAPGIASQVEASGANAVFLTSGNDGALPFIGTFLPENGLSATTYQYLSLQPLNVTQSLMSLPGLQGAWFATPDPALRTQFEARYQGQYGASPHPVASLAYDGIAAVGALISAGSSDALTGQALTRPSGFAGVNGVFRLLPNGTNQRGLAVAQIQNSQVVILDPAPRSFGGPGF